MANKVIKKDELISMIYQLVSEKELKNEFNRDLYLELTEIDNLNKNALIEMLQDLDHFIAFDDVSTETVDFPWEQWLDKLIKE
jgi:hypothetical protein